MGSILTTKLQVTLSSRECSRRLGSCPSVTRPLQHTGSLMLRLMGTEATERALSTVARASSFFKQEWIYLFSKTPSLPKETVDRWMTYMKAKGIDTSDVKMVPQA